MISSRRNFLIRAAASLVAAPAIVRAASLMPVKAAGPVFEQEKFLGYDIVYGRSPAMIVLPALKAIYLARAHRVAHPVFLDSCDGAWTASSAYKVGDAILRAA